ncbi:MAG: peptidase U32 family protein [Promethearchaeota archaeon]
MPGSNLELLAPLNDWKTLTPKLNVLKNSDSVYFGIQSRFSMRSRAGNFALEELSRLSKQVHDNGKKLYVCTNIVVYNNEIQELREVLESAFASEIDSVICYDFASIQIAKEIGMNFHISTQMNISNVLSANYFESIGASRINLARELNLEQIQEVASQVKVPVECFVHGAMCTALSGRCYLSAELMGFSQSYSANRGKCAHQCRRFYTFVGEDGELLDFEPSTGRFFNAKDLCMIEHIDELMDRNISAFKIEGRMRDPLYISETVKCYREAIESVKTGNYCKEMKKKWIDRLMKVYNRGFHTGFYFSQPDPRDIEIRAKGNTSLWKRKMVGRITDQSLESSLATIEITSGMIKIGDSLVIQNEAGFYSTMKITALFFEGESIQETGKASSDVHYVVSFLTHEPIPIHSKVFKLHEVKDPVIE